MKSIWQIIDEKTRKRHNEFWRVYGWSPYAKARAGVFKYNTWNDMIDYSQG